MTQSTIPYFAPGQYKPVDSVAGTTNLLKVYDPLLKRLPRGKNRKVNLYIGYCVDSTQNQIFPGWTAHAGPVTRAPYQIADKLEQYTHDIQVLPATDYENDVTMRLREDARRIGRVLNMASLRASPNYFEIDTKLCPMPLNHTCREDYLTTHNPVVFDFLLTLVQRLIPTVSELERSTVVDMLTDFGAGNPYGVLIRQDGRLKMAETTWRSERMRYFSETLDPYIRHNIESQTGDDIHVSLNVTKSIGVYDLLPDGSRYDRNGDLFGLASTINPDDLEHNTAFRHDHSAFKLLNLDTAIANFEWAYTNKNYCRTPQDVIEAMMRGAVTIARIALRRNNQDEILNDVSDIMNAKSFKELAGKLYTKDRDFAFTTVQDGHVKFVTGVYDAKKMNRLANDVSGGQIQGALNKLRNIQTSSAGTYSPCLNAAFKLCLRPIEDSCCGFPSLNKNVMARYERAFTNHVGWGRAIIAFDRKNFEQFITDNWETFLQVVPSCMRRLFEISAPAIVQDLGGPRFLHGLLSGAPHTSATAIIAGMFEMCNLLTVAFDADDQWPEIFSGVINTLATGQDGLEFNQYFVPLNLGTDDQVAIIFKRGCTNEELTSELKRRLEHFCDGRSLSLDVSDATIVFGLYFSISGVEVAHVLGLKKIFFCEHQNNGDFQALQLSLRLKAQGDRYEIIRDTMMQYGFGDPSTYDQGAMSALNMLREFGFMQGDIYNEYNPTERITMGPYLRELGIDPIHARKLYPQQLVETTKRMLLSHI